MNIDIRIETAKDHSEIPIINDFYIHSKYHPIEEGIKLANTILEQKPNLNIPLVVYGLGFGYHILPLLNYFNQIYVVESFSELIQLAKNKPHLTELFAKVKIIQSIDECPYISDYISFSLRSEYRWQEAFFKEISKKMMIKSSEYSVQPDELRVLVNFPVYGGSFTTAEYVSKAFSELGCSVQNMNNEIAEKLLRYILEMNQYQGTMAQKLTNLMSNLLWERFISFKPHIIFCLAQAPIDNEVIKAIRQTGTVVVFWFVEDFRRFPYWQDVSKYVDYFYVIQKGEFESLLKQMVTTKTPFLPMAAPCNFSDYASLDNSDASFFTSDVSFMGAAFVNRVQFFNQLKPQNFKLWGTGWYQFDQFKNFCPLKDQRISIAQSVKIYQNTKININLHSSMENDILNPYGDFINPRTFEIMACNAFQLVDDSPAIREFFVPDRDLVVFTTIEEAIDKIQFYLRHESLRKKIALSAYQKVKKYHTYSHRMKQVLDQIISESPFIRSCVENEQDKLKQVVKKINDPDFENLIAGIKPAMRNSTQHIIQKIKQSSFKNNRYKNIVSLLETFLGGE